jgi:hypothetical protein
MLDVLCNNNLKAIVEGGALEIVGFRAVEENEQILLEEKVSTSK